MVEICQWPERESEEVWNRTHSFSQFPTIFPMLVCPVLFGCSTHDHGTNDNLVVRPRNDELVCEDGQGQGSFSPIHTISIKYWYSFFQ
jgi:hypothetical protein